MSDKGFCTCPYDSSHRVHKSRMARHLIKCRLNYPNVQKKTCPYNKIHLLDPCQYEYHLTVCEERNNRENIVYETDNNTLFDISVPKVQNIFSQYSENWDDSDAISYHSHLVCDGVTNPITRHQEYVDKNKD
ncbi:hypothetical protein M0804_013713 [Polistes exclamans]|nr:hypothetical protein M0804_013713 [Polistes exclamans]